MGRKKQWPPPVRAHRASGQDRVYVNGAYVYLGKSGSAQARLRYAQLLAELEAAAPGEKVRPPKGALTVAEVVELHEADARARYDPAGREAAQYRWACAPLLARHGATAAARFGARELEEVRERMIELGWSRAVINRRVVRLRTLFRWAEQKGHVPPGAWNALRALAPLARHDRRARDLPPRGPCSWADLARCCRFCPRAARDLLLCVYFTGARPGELRTLRVRDLDLRSEPPAAVPAAHKNDWRGQGRRIVLGPRAMGVIAKRLPGLRPDDYLFGHAPGRCYSLEGFTRAVARACERAGVKLTAYEGRHAAKQRFTREAGLDAARAALGQASLQAADRYAAGPDARLAAEAARKAG